MLILFVSSVIGHENEDQELDPSAIPGLSPQNARMETRENSTIPDPLSQVSSINFNCSIFLTSVCLIL